MNWCCSRQFSLERATTAVFEAVDGARREMDTIGAAGASMVPIRDVQIGNSRVGGLVADLLPDTQRSRVPVSFPVGIPRIVAIRHPLGGFFCISRAHAAFDLHGPLATVRLEVDTDHRRRAGSSAQIDKFARAYLIRLDSAPSIEVQMIQMKFWKLLTVVMFTVSLVVGTVTAGGPSPGRAAGIVSVFATGLLNPRGLKFGPDGNLYVAEGGTGGQNSTVGSCEQVVPPVGPYTGSQDGARISMIDPSGVRTTFVGNLPSSQTSAKPAAMKPAAITTPFTAVCSQPILSAFMNG